MSETPDNDEEIIENVPLTETEMEELRRARPNWKPPRPQDTLINDADDTTVVLLGPILGREAPPSEEEFSRLMQEHPARVARPSIDSAGYYGVTLKHIAHYAEKRSGEWLPFAEHVHTLLNAYHQEHPEKRKGNAAA